MLFKKMLRDIKEQKGSYFACVIVIALGLMVYSSLSMVMDNLLMSRNTFYEKENFADGFADIEAMPYSEVQKLSQIEGIEAIQGRLVKDVRVLFPDREENVYLRLVSMDTSQAFLINDVLQESGIPLDQNEMNIWVDNKFFAANNLKLNESLNIIAEGKKRTLQIVGTGKSPEFIYALRTSSDLFPDPEKFGIGFVPLEIMDTLFQEKGSINNIVFLLQEGADYNQVERLLEEELKPYGLKRVYPRKDQMSHVLLSQELSSLKATAKTMPLIFLAVASMILYIMLKRMIETQRTQLGTLKAFGYTTREIMYHYLSYAFLVGTVGGVLGGISGFALTVPFLEMYREYFNMPGMKSEFSGSYFFFSIILSLVFSLFAGYQGCKKILRLAPAEAMRPPAPPSVKEIFLEKISSLWNMFTVQGKMALRNMVRNKLRTLFLFIGIMFTFSLLALPWSFKTLSDQMFFEQFRKIETYDIKMPFVGPLNQSKVERELAHFPGVKIAETMTEVPVTLKNSWKEKDTIIVGLKKDSRLYHVLDKNDHPVPLPSEGIVISKRLADLLDADIGSELYVESPYLEEDDKTLPVVGIIPQNLGLNAYMEINALQDFLGQGKFATSAILSIEKESIPLLKEEYNNSSMINSIENRLSLLHQMQELMSSFIGMILSLFVFGIITGFAIIYNSSTITLSERSRELASMMVLGMTPKEVLEVITFEQWFVSIFAMAAGIPLTKAFLVGMAEAIGNDVFSFTPELHLESILIAFAFTFLSIFIAQRMAARKINNLDLVEVLKSRE